MPACDGCNLSSVSSSRAARHATLLLCSTFLFLGPQLCAQYSERVEVSIANVDVVVTDRDGKPVRGLTREDFEIRENGKLQPITNFTAFDGAAVAAPAAAPGVDPGDTRPLPTLLPRLIVIFVDIRDIDPPSRQRFFSGVRDFLHTAVRENDLVTVLTWNHRILTVLAPTSDERRVEVVIDGYSKPYGPREQEMVQQLAELNFEQAAQATAVSDALGNGLLPDADAEAEFIKWARDEERCQAIKRKALELRNLLVSLSRVDMQKILLFASDDLSLQPSRHCLTNPEIEALAATANAYGMTIHALHPPGPRDKVIGPDRGRYTPPDRAPTPLGTEYTRAFDEAGGLLLLAERTGGLASSGPRQSARALEQVASELDSYYSLGYRMAPGGEDKPRGLEVTSKNRKYRVRARQTVVRLSESSRLRDLVTTNLYLPERTVPQTPSFDARVVKTTRDGRFRLVDVELSIRARDLVLLPSTQERFKGSFSVFLTAGRELGDASDVKELTEEFETAKKDEAESRVTYTFTTRIRPDTTRLSIAVRDNVSGDVATKVVALGSKPDPEQAR